MERDKLIDELEDGLKRQLVAGHFMMIPDGMVRDIIDKLREQEPRVMTLAEALGSEECWLERKDGSVTVADIALNGQDSKMKED